jgi:hypothetical protein
MAAAIYTPIRIPPEVMEKIKDEMKRVNSDNKSKVIISLLKKQLKIKTN